MIHDGSGIKMAAAVIAKTTNMDEVLAVGFVYTYDVYPPGDGSLNRAPVSSVLVNPSGRRFVNEDRYGPDNTEKIVEDEHAEEIPGNPSSAHLVLDDDLFQLGDGVPDEAVNFRTETLTRADSVAELAEKIDLPTDVLEDRIECFNEQTREGRYPEFHKRSKFLEPVDKPPYYAFNLRLGAFDGKVIWYHTLWGVSVTLDGEVINTSDETIDGLYAVSQAIDGVTGENYESGISLAENVFFGRRTGRAVATDRSE